MVQLRSTLPAGALILGQMNRHVHFVEVGLGTADAFTSIPKRHAGFLSYPACSKRRYDVAVCHRPRPFRRRLRGLAPSSWRRRVRHVYVRPAARLVSPRQLRAFTSIASTASVAQRQDLQAGAPQHFWHHQPRTGRSYMPIDWKLWLGRIRRLRDSTLLPGGTDVGNSGCSSLSRAPPPSTHT